LVGGGDPQWLRIAERFIKGPMKAIGCFPKVKEKKDIFFRNASRSPWIFNGQNSNLSQEGVILDQKSEGLTKANPT
jgi:hypothetical protein